MDTINETYTSAYCHQLELAYGNNMMSEGSAEAIDQMFEAVSLTQKRALDFGSGLGGVAFYLASKHNARVVGVEVNPEMIATALKNRPETLKNLVDFQLIDASQRLPFPDETFDIVYSKGVIVHLPDNQRDAAFKEFYRVLKKGGKLVIHDWLSPTDAQWSPEMQDLIETESLPLYAHSPQSYTKELGTYGFQNIHYSNYSNKYATYNQKVVDRLTSQSVKDIFVKTYGEQTYQDHLEGYQNIRDANKTGKGITGHFIADK